MKSRRVGLMGGTFDPIHLGHLVAAERALEAGALDEVRFMPAFRPPHKTVLPSAPPEHRRAMVELAIAGNDKFMLEPIELARGGLSYAADTAAALAAREPDAEWFWIVGGDMALYLPKWNRIRELAELVRFLAMTRPGYPVDPNQLPEWLRDKVETAEMPALEISSTDIRERLAAGRSIRYVVPDAVVRYIEEKGLYRHDDAHDH